jgi:hypothetical protein
MIVQKNKTTREYLNCVLFFPILLLNHSNFGITMLLSPLGLTICY